MIQTNIQPNIGFMILRTKPLLFILFFWTLLTTVSLAAENNPPPTKLESVKLQLKWFHAFQFAGYYAAKEQGYYAEEGLEVEFIEHSPGHSVVDKVVSGKVDYGIETSGLLIHHANGVPIKALAAIFQHNPLVFISKESSEIIGPDDMRGKRIMMFGDKSGTYEAPLQALLYDAQLSKDQYTHIPQSFNDDDLINDKTDVIVGYITDQPFYYQSRGININIINPLSYGYDFYGDILFTSNTELNRHPGRSERFRRASLKGWRYALDHQEELIQLILTKYQSKASLGRLRFEANKTSQLISANSISLGQIKTSRLRQIASIYHDLRLTKQLTDNDLENFVYDHPNIAKLNLSTDEHQWLKNHPIIRVGIDNAYAPHEWVDKKGRYTGHAADYMNLLQDRLNIKFDIVKDKTWYEIVDMAKDGQIDMLSDVSLTPQRQQYLSFTTPYTQYPVIIITDATHTYLNTLESLKNKNVVIEKGYFLNDLLQTDHPDIDLIPAKNTEVALNMLVDGTADAYLGDAASVNYSISQTGLLNLRFAGQTSYQSEHRIGVIKAHPLLVSSLNKALASITREEKSAITSRWLGLQATPGIKTETIFKYAAGMFILFILFIYWVYRLRNEIAKRQQVELNLRKTQARFVTSQHSANFGVWEWDISNNQLYWSETVAPLFGYKKRNRDSNLDLFRNAIHPDDQYLINKNIQSCIKNGQGFEIEHRVIWPDGTIRWLFETGDAVFDKQGTAVQLLGIVRDITQRKLSDNVLQTLAESNASGKESIFRLIVRELAVSQDIDYAILGKLNTDNPQIVNTLTVWGNGNFLENFSYGLPGTPCENVMQDGNCFYPDNIQRLFPDDTLLAEMRVNSYMGVPLKDKNHKTIGILALINKKPMEYQHFTENLLNSLAVRAAIELERFKTEKSLQVASLVFQNTQEAIMVSDAENHILAINPAFTEMTGYSEQDLLGHHSEQFQTDSTMQDIMRETVSHFGDWQGEINTQRKNGKTFIIWTAINTILDECGTVNRRVSIFSDITELKEAEKLIKNHRDQLQLEVKRQTLQLEQAKNEAVRANQIKSEFLANMSHELRTPMHGVLSFARLGIKNIAANNEADFARYFDRINICGERLLCLLNDLLDLSKLEAGKMEINKEICNLHTLVKNCIAEQEAWLKSKQINILWETVCDTPQARFDQRSMTQVVANLLSNAIKFSEEGTNLYLNICRTELNNQAALHFSIQDQGAGIPELELESIFDKFIQSSKTSTGAGGTGLGLAICREIISIHKGKIWVKNVKQGGAKFQFIIPELP